MKINRHLTDNWSRVVSTGSEKVFVPLCGKSTDMLWLQQQGHEILGVELSTQAVESFFTENNLSMECGNLDDFEQYNATELSPSINLLAGDFFALTPSRTVGCEAFYDRASLIALPPEMRREYAMQLSSVLPSGSRGLLISIAYNQEKMKGPPFSVPDSEVRQLFEGHFSVEQLGRFNGPEHVGNLANRGLESLDERVYLLIRK